MFTFQHTALAEFEALLLLPIGTKAFATAAYLPRGSGQKNASSTSSKLFGASPLYRSVNDEDGP